MANLRGKVRIDTAQAALDFVRLQTLPLTCGYFGFEYMEVMEESALEGIASVPGWTDYKPWETGLWGAAPQSWLTAHRIDAATVNQSQDGWQVTRWVAKTNEEKPQHLYLLDEQVTTDGGYRRKISRTLTLDPREKMHFFVYMDE